MSTDSLPEELLRELSERLGLRFETQDWGILNSDPDRVEEFARFYETADLAPTQQYELGDLVLASANDALVKQMLDENRLRELEAFITRNRDSLQAQINYWAGLDSEVEFPIAAVLKRLEQ